MRGKSYRDFVVLTILFIILISILAYEPNTIYTVSGKSIKKTKSLTLTFPRPLIKKAVIGKREFDVVRIPGTKLCLVPGAPIIPVRVEVIKLPLECRNISIRYSFKLETLRGKYKLLPTPLPQILEKRSGKEIYVEDPFIYNSSEPYPKNLVVYEIKRGIDPLTLERIRYLIIRLYPVQYIPREGVIRYMSQVELNIEYERYLILQYLSLIHI